MKTKQLLAAIAIGSIILVAGCKKDDFVGKVGVCPFVVSTVPMNAATGVPLNQVITVTFNEKMNPATITQATFSVKGDTKIAGLLTYDGTGPTFSFTPTVQLLPNTTYTGRVSATVKNMTGNNLQEDYVWSFTTPLPQLTLSLSANPLAGGTTTGSGTYPSGTPVTAAAVPNSGYAFTNWTEGTTVVSTNASYPFNITGSRTLVANFSVTARLYTLTTHATNGTVTKNPDEAAYTGGTSVLLTATPNQGFTFVSWSGDASGAVNPLTVVMNSDKNITANFTATINTYTLTVSANPLAGGTTSGAGTYNSGTQVTTAATPNSGFAFTNWTEGGTVVSTEPGYTFNLTGNRTLVANFSVNARLYVLTTNATNGTVTKNPDEAAYTAGTSVLLTATPNAGYTFVSWSGDASGSANPLTVVMNSDKNITANFTATIITYTLTLSANPLAGGTTTGAGTYNAGTQVTAATTPNTGFTFTNWTEGTNVVSSDPAYTFNLTGNRTLVANYTANVNSYTLTLLSNPIAGGTTTGAGAYNSGTEVTAGASANSGFTFVNWTEGANIVSTNANYSFAITGNRTLTANFSENVRLFTLTVNAINGTVTKNPDEAAYTAGTSVLLTATPNAGYTFVSWSGDASGSTNPLTVVMNSDKNITANFTATVITYTLNLSTNPLAGGTTIGAGTYDSGTQVTAATTPNTGFTFTNWTEGTNVVSTNAVYTFNLSGNRTLVANYTANVNSYTLTLVSNPIAGGTTTGAGAYNSGTQVTAGATANNGFTFTNWTEGANIVSTNASYAFTITGNRTLVANFTAIVNSYTLALSANPLAGGTTVGAGTYVSGTQVTAATTPNIGFTFVNWTEGANVVSTNAIYAFTITGNRTLVAHFTATINSYTLALSANPLAGGTTTGAGAYNSGAQVTAGAVANNGFTFTNWTEGANIVSTNASYTFSITGNRTLVANFTTNAITFTLNVTAINGTVVKNPDQLTYNSGSSVQLTATADLGYTFTSWSGDATGSLNPLTVVMNSNKNITANFTREPVGPGVVDLGTAGNFTILTKTGISTTGVTSITGDIGVSPAAATYITGFGLIMDINNQSSHTPIVIGKVYASNYAAPTPANMTTAVSNMETAFTTANNLVMPAPIVDLYAGDISGRNLHPGLYKWSTGLLITSAGVTLTGGPDDTWVFQIAQDFTVGNSAIITLAGGAQAKNIFWVVTGKATLGSNVNLSGNILSKTLISLNTGAVVTGRLLAQTAVTLNASTVILP